MTPSLLLLLGALAAPRGPAPDPAAIGGRAPPAAKDPITPPASAPPADERSSKRKPDVPVEGADEDAPAPPPEDDDAKAGAPADAPLHPEELGPDPVDEGPAPTLRELKKERRQERRRALFEGPNKKPEADFLRRDTELRVRLAFNGYTPGPFSLFTSLTGWNELSLVVDHGVASWRGFTIGVGASAWYDQAALLGALTQPVANYEPYRFRWRMFETGGALRATAHWTALQGVDPYLAVALGAGLFHLDAGVRGWPREADDATPYAVVERPYLRAELGGGLNWRLGRSRFFVGLELRYLITSQIRPERQIDLTWQGEQASFLLFPQHKPPKGFAWVVGLGVRL